MKSEIGQLYAFRSRAGSASSPPPESKICPFCPSANSPPPSVRVGSHVFRNGALPAEGALFHRVTVKPRQQSTRREHGLSLSHLHLFAVSKGANIARRGVHHSALVMKTLGAEGIRDGDSALGSALLRSGAAGHFC